METKKINILVVLYKKSLSESETIRSLYQMKEWLTEYVHLIIWDNSPITLSEEEKYCLCNEFSSCLVSFYGDGKNYYLSKVYNTIIRLSDEDSILVILDHDSTLAENYLECLLKAVNDKKNSDINLFLPIVWSHKNIVSPAYVFWIRRKLWKVPVHGKISSQNITAINSGMAMRCSYLKKQFVGYNERLQFYVTDDDFMYKYRSQNQYLYVLDTHIKHSLNFFEDDIESKLKRFKAMKYGCLTASKEKNMGLYLLEHIRYKYLAIKYAIIYNNIRFLSF